jgi:hypothetical protein
MAGDADGNFVVTWSSLGQDGSSDGIYAQRSRATTVLIASITLRRVTQCI